MGPSTVQKAHTLPARVPRPRPARRLHADRNGASAARPLPVQAAPRLLSPLYIVEGAEQAEDQSAERSAVGDEAEQKTGLDHAQDHRKRKQKAEQEQQKSIDHQEYR